MKRAATGAIFAIAALAFAPIAAVQSAGAQSAANPTDVLAPVEEPKFTFTFRASELSDASVWDDAYNLPALELSAGEKWGFTFGLENSYTSDFNLDGVRAGAFFDVTPRLRFGGQLSFTDSEDFFTRGTNRDDIPEVKFESAFKF